MVRTVPGWVGLDEAVAALEALPADYAALLEPHAVAHDGLYGRISLRLRAPVPTEPTAPVMRAQNLVDRYPWVGSDRPRSTHASEELLAGPVGPAVVETLFDAGRYAIISATGALPPNLQGVWSGTWEPAWSGDYTIDGNLQSAVAALLPTGTPELMLPLFDLLDRFRDDFARNARLLYGADGILLPAHLATHGRQNHFNETWCLTMWTAGAAWLGRLYHDYWRYTGDREFLARRAVPFLASAADFYCDFATISAGVASFAPSYSPENSPSNTGSQACVDATMDVAAVRDLLRNLLSAVDELGVSDPRAPRWRRLLVALPGYRIAPDGELAEWLDHRLADNHAHRHASHLFGLWYEPDPALSTPALREAAAEAVRRRLAWWRGAEADEMAFGLVQLGLAAAHLGLAAEAYEAVRALARYWRPNLISTHNVDRLLNTDVCGGLPAVVLAMVASSAHGLVRLLPALPPEWPSGVVAGLALRGPLLVESLRWWTDTPARPDAARHTAPDKAGPDKARPDKARPDEVGVPDEVGGPDEVEAVLCPAFTGRLRLRLPAGLSVAEFSGAVSVGRLGDGELLIDATAQNPFRLVGRRH